MGQEPICGVLVGAGVTALLQSSSASVGILQALAATGAISLQASLFILFGQNIGTCVTALLASVGANRTAKRAAVVHLLFNIIGAALFIIIALALPLASWIEMLAGANLRLQIAFAHIIFNVVTTLLLLPLSGLLEKLAYLVVRGEDKQEEPMRLEYFDTQPVFHAAGGRAAAVSRGAAHGGYRHRQLPLCHAVLLCAQGSVRGRV